MTAPAATQDRLLHLSLPDWRTALKRRVKRPKRPNWSWLTFTLFYAALLVRSFFARDWISFGACAIALGYGWWMVATGRRQIVWRYYLPVCVVCFVPLAVSL
jgi:hypothetical protein